MGRLKCVKNCLNPFPLEFCHVIYYQCDKKYPCPGAIGLCKQAVMISISFTYTFQFFHCRSKKKVPKQKKFTALHNKGIAKYLHKKICSVDPFFFKFRQKCLVFYVHIITMNKSISSVSEK